MATANEIPAMWDLAIFGSFFILGFFGVYGVCLFRGNGKMRENGRVIVPHDPFFSRPLARRPTGRREAASEGSMTVSVVHAQGVAWAVLAGWCLRVIPRPPCLIWAMPEDGPARCVVFVAGSSFGSAAELVEGRHEG
jgi:hypothetical protein